MKWSKLSPWGESKPVQACHGTDPAAVVHDRFTINSNKEAQHSLLKYDQTTTEVAGTKQVVRYPGRVIFGSSSSGGSWSCRAFPCRFRWATGCDRGPRCD